MQSASYYRQEAARARRLARTINHPEAHEALERMSRDYDDIAEDLDRGAIEITHPSRLPQRKESHLR